MELEEPVNALLPASMRLAFEEEVRRFEAGERTEDEFRNARVPMGVYEQRDRGVFMARVRIPAGRLTAYQLMAAADAADLYGSGQIHLTTRQDIQLHGLPLKHIVPALRALLKSGLHTRGGGGNTIRNITCCAACDLTGEAILDAGPLIRRLTEKLMLDTESYRLPRKLKIAFSTCPADCAEAAFADIGFVARETSGGGIGFQVLAGGGLGAKSARGFELEPFVPPDEVYLVTAAVRKIFCERGKFGDKHHSRLRFLVEDAGADEFKKRYLAEKESMRDWLAWPIVPDSYAGRPSHDPSGIPPGPGYNFRVWKKTCVAEQTVNGYYAVTVPLLMGDAASESIGALAEFLWKAGLGELRITPQQNLVIPHVPGALVPDLYGVLGTAGLDRAFPKPISAMSVCAGTGACQLGICRSKDAAAEIIKLSDRPYWRHPAFRRLSIRVSGCPNQCARPGAAVLGFIGAARSHDGVAYPAYQVMWGAKISGALSRLAEPQGTVPARRLAGFVDGFLDRLAAVLPRDADINLLIRYGGPILRACLSQFQDPPAYASTPLFYRDIGADETLFTTLSRGEGECAAG